MLWALYRGSLLSLTCLDVGQRRTLYELYHKLNHYNLFGGGYRNAACQCLEQCLSSLD